MTDSVVTFTATFDHAVAGVVGSDFNVASTNGVVTWTETVTKKDATGKVWEVAVSVSGGFADTDFSVSTPENSGAIDRPNAAATNNNFALLCTCVVVDVHRCRYPLTLAPLHVCAAPQTARRARCFTRPLGRW